MPLEVLTVGEWLAKSGQPMGDTIRKPPVSVSQPMIGASFKFRHLTCWSTLLLLSSLLGGCASFAPVPDATAGIASGMGVVFGREVTVLNRRVITGHEARHLVPAQIVSHISPYTSDADVSRNAFLPGKWAIRARDSQDGYFAVFLPPGRYYFVEHDYINIFPRPYDSVGMRSYMRILGDSVNRPFITTFEVVPGRATYIGSLYHLAESQPGNVGLAWGLNIVDERSSAYQWLVKGFPELKDVATDLASNHPLDGE